MKKTILILCSLLTCESVEAQTLLNRQWTSFHNGALSNHDYGKAIIAGANGLVYVTGRSFENNVTGSLVTVCYSSGGTMLWTDFYKGPIVTAINEGRDICLDPFGNVFVTGTVAFNDGDFAILKFNGAGRLWARDKEPYWFGSGIDEAREIACDDAGNVYCTASIQSLSGNLQDLYLLKCDSSGNDTWSIDYSSASGDDWAEGFAITPDGHSFAITSSYNFFGSATYDMQTLHHDSAGNQQWIVSYNYPVSQSEDYPVDIQCDAAYNSWVCGAADVGTQTDMAAIKQNVFGTKLWEVTYNGSANGQDTAIAIASLPHNLSVVTGKTEELVNGSVRLAITTQLLDSGTVLWTRQYFGDSLDAFPTAMKTDSAGNIYICGSYQTGTGSNGVVLVYDTTGVLSGYDEYNGTAGLQDYFNDIYVDATGTIYVTGQTQTGPGNSDIVTIRYGTTVQQVTEHSVSVHDIMVYPNPAGSASGFYYEGRDLTGWEILDMTGKQLASGYPSATGGYQPVNLEHIPSGIYFLKIKTINRNITKKLLRI